MLGITFYDLHIEGGVEYISPLTALFVVNLVILVYLIIALVQNKTFNAFWIEAIRQVGILILALGTFGTVVGFLQMFDALEATKETLPLQVISGGVKVALLAAIYGLALFSISQAMYIILKIAFNKKLAS